MNFEKIISTIALLCALWVLGIVAPWWIFACFILLSIVFADMGPEIFLVTLLIDIWTFGSHFTWWYSYGAFIVYTIYYVFRRELFHTTLF